MTSTQTTNNKLFLLLAFTAAAQAATAILFPAAVIYKLTTWIDPHTKGVGACLQEKGLTQILVEKRPDIDASNPLPFVVRWETTSNPRSPGHQTYPVAYGADGEVFLRITSSSQRGTRHEWALVGHNVLDADHAADGSIVDTPKHWEGPQRFAVMAETVRGCFHQALRGKAQPTP